MRKLKAFANFDIEKLFNDFEKEYLSCCHGQRNTEYKEQQHSTNNACRYFVKDKAEEEKIIKNFLRTPCKCGNSCQKKLDLEEVLNVRNDFQQLSWREKGCFILPLLNSFRTQANTAKSARTVLSRSRQKYTYRINYDREVCRDTFLFYYDLSIAKLRYFQNHLVDIGMTPPEHGNIGRKPANSYSENDKNHIKKFMINFATAHGMPDPGRDLRSGIEKFKIFLPSVMSYKHVHTVYLKSLSKRNRAVEYQSFIRIWQEATPNIEFQKPKTDMCGTCEDHIKNIRMAIGRKKEDEKIKYYREAIKHLKHAKKERDHYRDIIKKTQKVYQTLLNNNTQSLKATIKKKFSMHYSWDLAQQINYPYEDQQVGPIYFKTPRKTQLFGICCEAVPFQMNYLVDEADILGKGPNTIISFLDHFFKKHGLGESYLELTADNCPSQNKNNSMIHYLLYRTMIGLHDTVRLSFMVVGHTKFGPDGYFGLIKRILRRAKFYTYDQIVELIHQSSPNGHVLCQSFRNKHDKQNYQYYDWCTWFSQYFNNLPGIKKYHHFYFDKKKPGQVFAKESVDGEVYNFNLLKDKNFRFDNLKPGRSFIVTPKGLSIDRQWYLYDKIREHIPNKKDKDSTCPKPKTPKNSII